MALATARVIAQQQPTFRASVRLVETNVLVHDRNGQPVSGVTAADFHIFEDGKEQKIEVFSVQTSHAPATAAGGAPAPAGQLPAGVFTNRVAAVIEGGVTVILFDRLNSSFEDQKNARDQIVKFIATLQPGDRVALYVLESEAVTVLHDFTDDVARLIASANRYLGQTSVELSRSEEKADVFGRTGDMALDADTEAWLNATSLRVSESFLKRRVALTTSALEQIGHHLAGIPGRKNLVWVSAAFPFEIATDHGAPQNMTTLVSRATRAINNADVAIYPIDIRGLIGAFVNPAAATATLPAGARPPVFTTMADTHPNQDSMRTIAEDTGGRAFLNSNAIGQAVRRAIDDSRVSYVLGYYSPRPEGDGRFREISVKVNRDGVDVRHRKGYLALPPAAPGNAKSRLTALDRVLQSPIEAAGISLSAEIDRRGNKPTLVVRVDPAALTWDTSKAIRDAAMDVVIAQSLPDGRYFKIKETTVNLTADPERYQQMVEDGLTLSSEFTPRAGAYRMHVVISDVASQAVGSLIIPIKNN